MVPHAELFDQIRARGISSDEEVNEYLEIRIHTGA